MVYAPYVLNVNNKNLISLLDFLKKLLSYVQYFFFIVMYYLSIDKLN